ncbi:MAG: mitochondrial fission ELM1 family protein, partial [Pseudomonadota bacterium]
RTILALSDDRASNSGQARGLADAVAARTGAQVQAIQLPRRAPLADALTAWTGLAPGPLTRLPKAALAIGAGRVGTLAAAYAGRDGAKTIAILRPPLPGLQFDLIVAPEHDQFFRPNAVSTLGGLHGLTDARIAEAAAILPDLPQPLAAILIGGPSGTATFDKAAEARLMADLTALRATDHHLYATTSRRTPKPLIGRLRDAFPDMTLYTGEGPNPYPGLLGRADVIAVTSDSISMISEALFTGRPVIVTGAEQTSPKHARFHASIADRLSSAASPYTAPEPLREAERIADMIVTRGLV